MKLKNLLLIALVAIVFCGCQSNYQPTSITVASYNLRNANGGDSINGNGWGQRYPVIAQIVQYHDFDIFGTQECFIHQLKDMKEALPGYDYIGVGRDDGKEKGDFWLSETPDMPSKGWDAVLPRICSWGHFKCKDTGFEFLFFNLHMDHIGKKARVESAFLVQDKMKELGKGERNYHKEIGEFIDKYVNVKLITVGTLARYIAQNSKHISKSFPNNKGVAAFIKSHASEGCAILFKASRSMKFEEIIKELEKL